MNPLQATKQQQRGQDTVRSDKKPDGKRIVAEVGIIGGSAVAGLAGLITIGHRWISTAPAVLVPFVVGAALPLFTLFAIIYQAVVYRRQWNVMQDNLDQTERIVEKMQAQLDGIDRQAKAMEDSVTESRKLVAHSEQAAKDQLLALQGQWKAMDESLEENRKLVAQNNRVLELTEAADAPYFGINEITPIDFEVGGCPRVIITYFNGGRMPAWRFYPIAALIVGDHQAIGDIYELRLKTLSVEKTFFAANGGFHRFEFEQSKFRLTDEIVKARDEGKFPHLFVVTTVEYRGRGNVETQRETFRCVWNKDGRFSNFDVA